MSLGGQWLRGLLLALSGWLLAPAVAYPAAPVPTVRVAVVGGLVLCGVWPALRAAAEQATGLHIDTVAASPKEGIVPVFRRGEADLMLIHGSDETYALQAEGLAAPLRAWAMNEHVIVGPRDDPARVAGSQDAREAMGRIIASDAPMIGFRDPGSFALSAGLLRGAKLRIGPRQQLFDESEPPTDVVRTAARLGAYVIVGHIPVAFGKMPSDGMAVLLQGDPALRRVYVAVEPGPRHPTSSAARRAARQLADYLLSPAGQMALIRINRALDGPWVFPLPAGKEP